MVSEEYRGTVLLVTGRGTSLVTVALVNAVIAALRCSPPEGGRQLSELVTIIQHSLHAEEAGNYWGVLCASCMIHNENHYVYHRHKVISIPQGSLHITTFIRGPVVMNYCSFLPVLIVLWLVGVCLADPSLEQVASRWIHTATTLL